MKMKTTLSLLLILKLCGLSSCLIKQHFFVDQKKTWESAKNYCTTYFHDLSTFTNVSEEQQFFTYALSNSRSEAWVGLHREAGVWKWSGGENATQISWDTNHPNYDCALLRVHYKKFEDKRCDYLYPFFCMIISEFVLVRQKETWEGALEYCRTHYTDLASLSTTERMDSALMKISQADTEYVWTGLRFLAGDWFWISGDDLNYTAWDQNKQPQCPAGDLRCGALDQQTKLWTNRDCEEKLSFICLKKGQ